MVHGKDSELCSEHNGEPWEDSELGKVVIWFNVRKIPLATVWRMQCAGSQDRTWETSGGTS